MGKWKDICLSEIAEVFPSNVDKVISSTELPVLLCNYMDVYYKKFIHRKLSFSNGSVRPSEFKKFQLYFGDVIVTKDSETPNDIGMPAVVVDNMDNLVCGYHLAIIRADQSKYDGVFLMYALQGEKPIRYFSNMCNGLTRYGLTTTVLEKQKIYIPIDVDEQRKIAEIITTVDEAIDNTRTLIEKYITIKTGLMQDLLTNGIDEHGKIRSSKTNKYKDSPLGRIPVEWDIVELLEWSTKQSDSIVDGPFGSNLKLIHYRDSGIPVIQSGFVTTGKFVAKKYVFVDEAKFIEQYRCRVYPLDIIISKIGAQCGRCAVLPLSHPVSIIAGNCIKMTVDKNNNPYLLHELLSYYYQLGYFDLIMSVTAQPAINLTKLKKLKVVFIPKEEQERIYQVILSVNNKIQTERDYLAKLQDIKKGLMKDLLTPPPDGVSVDPLL